MKKRAERMWLWLADLHPDHATFNRFSSSLLVVEKEEKEKDAGGVVNTTF